jgi:hypothetical protein
MDVRSLAASQLRVHFSFDEAMAVSLADFVSFFFLFLDPNMKSMRSDMIFLAPAFVNENTDKQPAIKHSPSDQERCNGKHGAIWNSHCGFAAL